MTTFAIRTVTERGSGLRYEMQASARGTSKHAARAAAGKLGAATARLGHAVKIGPEDKIRFERVED